MPASRQPLTSRVRVAQSNFVKCARLLEVLLKEDEDMSYAKSKLKIEFYIIDYIWINAFMIKTIS